MAIIRPAVENITTWLVVFKSLLISLLANNRDVLEKHAASVVQLQANTITHFFHDGILSYNIEACFDSIECIVNLQYGGFGGHEPTCRVGGLRNGFFGVDRGHVVKLKTLLALMIASTFWHVWSYVLGADARGLDFDVAMVYAEEWISACHNHARHPMGALRVLTVYYITLST